MFYTKNLFLILSLLFSTMLLNGQNVIYVSQTAAGTNTGDSWTNAYTDLQSALGVAANGDQIWVAQGIYVPGTLPEETFTLTDGVELYGGFLGTESLLDQRNPEENPTILSGDVNQDDVYGAVVWYSGWNVTTPNSHHIMSGVGLSRSTVIDGFTFEAGYVAIGGGSSYLSNSGGGLFLQNSSPTVRNCVFRRNLASSGRGGAIYTSGGHPLISDCTFDENYAYLGRGAGIAIHDAGNLTVISSSFTDNFMKGADIGQALGGAIYSDIQAGTVRVMDCSFTNNTATTVYVTGQNPNYGGAIYSAGDSLQVYNSIFTGNESHIGGAIAVFSNLLLVNTVMNDNVAFALDGTFFSFGDRGGAIYFGGSAADGSIIANSTIINNSAGEGAGINNAIDIPFLLHNSIVYGNVATGEDVWILKAQIGGDFDSFYSCVEGVLQTEPGEDPPNPANFPGCIDTDPMIDMASSQLVLMDNSPCIDAGKNSFYSSLWPDEGFDRTNRFIDNPDVVDTGDGLAPIIDMGASENAASGACDPNNIAPATGLNVSFSGNQFTLSWTALPGTGPCQIQAGTSAANAQSIVVQGDSPSSKTFPSSFLTAGQTYGWRVRCACSSSPTTAGPWSAINNFSLPAGIASPESSDPFGAEQFRVFPNPGHELYTVQVENHRASQIVVRNVLGQVVWQTKLSLESATYNLQLDGPSGLYFFQLIGNDGQPIATTKVMKR
ncbi:T9SS type A sorting domain-containing protein [Cryomorphaceae bacterium 1068]|nr:T9SS type A sorting domain-containing protein [Cryomorphaceae bacterium 1068]